MKAQITLFIIIGILIVISLGITIFLASTVKKELSASSTISSTELEDTITSCLRQITQEGLLLLGEQGGHIFENQGGLTSPNAPPSITAPVGNVGSPTCENDNNCFFYSTPPKYPFNTFPFLQGEQTFKGYYGINNLPPLLPTEGTSSIKENLEYYISTHVQKCANLTQFETITISQGTPSAKLIMPQDIAQLETEQTLTTELIWDINATDIDGNIAHLERFTIKLPVRLSTIYYITKEYADSDVTDINYEPTTELPFTIKIQNTTQGSTIQITDTNSNLRGIPYKFTLTRQNRPPALWHIDNLDKIYVPPEGETTLRINGNKLTVHQPCEPFIEIELKSSDPDNDPTIFSIDNAQTLDINAKDIPQKTIRIYAHDAQSADFQDITLNIALCAPQ